MNEQSQHRNLSDLGYVQIQPAPELRPYIQCFWAMWRARPLPLYREEFMHPDGGSGIVFNFGDPFYHNGRYVHQICRFDGLNTRTVRLGLQGKVDAFGVHFNPGGAFALFSLPVGKLVSDFRTIGRDINSIYTEILHLNSRFDRVAVVENWLLRQLRHSDGLSLFVDTALNLIRNKRGCVPISEILETVYISQRQLERLFNAQVGMSPKKYARLMRIAAARESLKHAGLRNTAEVAYSSGFFDQAHFIREFKAVVGLSPREYLLRDQRRQNLVEDI